MTDASCERGLHPADLDDGAQQPQPPSLLPLLTGLRFRICRALTTGPKRVALFARVKGDPCRTLGRSAQRHTAGRHLPFGRRWGCSNKSGMDILSPSQRSARMASVRQKNTRPELDLRRALHAAGYRFRIHRKDLPGKPDIVFPARRKVVFVHGCFWHGHTCSAGKRPQSNASFWDAKINANIERDAGTEDRLSQLGWRTYVVWTCEMPRGSIPETLLRFLGPAGPATWDKD